MRERGRVQGIFFAGAHLVGGLTPALVLWLLGYMSWRAIFVTFGLVGFVWVAIWHTWFRNDPSEHPSVNAAERRDALATAASIPSPPAPLAPSATEKPMSIPSFPLPDSKPFWASQTIWSAIAVIGSSATGALFAWSANDMAGLSASLTALLGGVSAVVGRYRAVAPIGSAR